MLAVVVISAALSLGAHNRSEGKSTFVLDGDGRVAITITLGTLDLPELCDVDLSVSDRAGQEAKLQQCIERNLSRWLRVRGDEKPCVVVPGAWTEKSGTVIVEGSATCPAAPRDTLTIDWGLFAGTPLDHVSVATIQQPHGDPRLSLLSKRASKVVVEIKRPVWPWIVAASVVAVAVAVIVAVIVVRRRRRDPH